MKTEAISYRHESVELEGHLAYDPAKGPRPVVLVVHEWRGLNDYARKRAEQLAGLGYVGFAIDMYGKGFLAKDATEAAKLMTPFVSDRQLCRARITAAYSIARTLPQVDATKIAAIGYCFGGLAALELARSGADLKAVATFHANLSLPTPADARNIKAKVLACHGADDPNVPPAQVAAFQDEMRQAKVDWQFVAYGNTVHSFTFPGANSPASGLMYNPTSDTRSWKLLELFLAEAFA
ncbi:MAG: dienelactone hydrolase family protein [Gemmataceae bacterium]